MCANIGKMIHYVNQIQLAALGKGIYYAGGDFIVMNDGLTMERLHKFPCCFRF